MVNFEGSSKRFIFMVLSRIFCLGGSILKNLFRLSNGVERHAPPENLEKIVSRVG